jgi:hypothetical protein
VLEQSTKYVPNPNPAEVAAGRASVYDSWLYYDRPSENLPGVPLLDYPGSGSDHYKFMAYTGVPGMVAHVALL